MSFQKEVAAVGLSLAVAVFIMWASGLTEALGVGMWDILGPIPWWAFVAAFAFIAGGIVIERRLA